MNQHSETKQNGLLIKIIITSLLTISLCAGMFYLMNDAALAAETAKPQVIKTEYNDIAIPLAATLPQTPSGTPFEMPIEQKYTVTVSEFAKDLPAGALSADEAAKAGINSMNAIFGTKLNGQIIEMASLYDLEERAYWQALIRNADESYLGSFDVDALSGMILGISQEMPLDDADIAKSEEEQEKAYWQDKCGAQLLAAEEAAQKYFGYKAVSSSLDYVMGFTREIKPEDRAKFKAWSASRKGAATSVSAANPADEPDEDYEFALATALAIRVTDEYGHECVVTVMANTMKVRSIGTVQEKTEKSDLPNGIG